MNASENHFGICCQLKNNGYIQATIKGQRTMVVGLENKVWCFLERGAARTLGELGFVREKPVGDITLHKKTYLCSILSIVIQLFIHSS